MKKDIEETKTKHATVCDQCGLPVDYSLNDKAYTVGGTGINWEKLECVQLARPDESALDFHKACLITVAMKAEPAELAKVRPELFVKKEVDNG